MPSRQSRGCGAENRAVSGMAAVICASSAGLYWRTRAASRVITGATACPAAGAGR